MGRGYKMIKCTPASNSLTSGGEKRWDALLNKGNSRMKEIRDDGREGSLMAMEEQMTLSLVWVNSELKLCFQRCDY